MICMNLGWHWFCKMRVKMGGGERDKKKNPLSFFSKLRIEITGFPWLNKLQMVCCFCYCKYFCKMKLLMCLKKTESYLTSVLWRVYIYYSARDAFLVTLSTRWYEALFPKCVYFPAAFSFFGIQHSRLHSPENLEMLVLIHLATEGFVRVWETSEVIFRLWHLNISLQVQSKVYLFKL